MLDFWNRKKKHVSPLGGSPFAQQLLDRLAPYMDRQREEMGTAAVLSVYHGPRLRWNYRFDIPIHARDIFTPREWKAYRAEMAHVADAESFEPYRESTLAEVMAGDDLSILADMLCQAAARRPGGKVPVAFGITQRGEDFIIPCIVLLW